MSHLVVYSQVVYPESAVEDGTLAAALDKIGLELDATKKSFKWYGRVVGDYNHADSAVAQGYAKDNLGQCEAVVRPKGQTTGYEIGLIKNKEGTGLVPTLDFWGPGAHLRNFVGEKGERMATAYAETAIEMQAIAEGYTLERETLANGNIQLVATRYAV